MNTLLSWSLAILLAVGSAAPLFAQPTSAPDTPENACQQDIEVAAPYAPAGRTIVATIIQVDHQQGILTLETEMGRVLAFAAPEDIQDFQEGDPVVVCLVEEDPSQDLLQDSIRI